MEKGLEEAEIPLRAAAAAARLALPFPTARSVAEGFLEAPALMPARFLLLVVERVSLRRSLIISSSDLSTADSAATGATVEDVPMAKAGVDMARTGRKCGCYTCERAVLSSLLESY